MNQELKIKVTSNAESAVKAFKDLEKALKGTKTQLTSMNVNNAKNITTFRTMSKEGNNLLTTISKLDKDGNLKVYSQNVKSAEKATNSFASAINSITKIGNIIKVIGGAYAVFKGISGAIQKASSYSIDYSESLNLFNVVFGNIYKNGSTTFTELGLKADRFQKKLAYNFGVNSTEAQSYQALFQSMGESMGIDKASAYTMSKNSTNLVYDLSSLFNKEQEDTAEALRAGIYAGQTKPLRSYGIDITETSLQETLNSMALVDSRLQDLTVSTMSQAEKQLLRYMTVLRQTGNAQGDFANTIESPANLLKTLENQLVNMSVALGNLFVGPFQKILQYANAIVIVVTRIAQSIANLFGINAEDYNTGGAGVAGLGEYEDSLDNIGTNADNATKSAKALNRQLMKFDEVNNINDTNAGSSGGTGGSGGGVFNGINKALLENLKGYDNGLNNVRLKAQDIADNIMRWLGYTKQLNLETGEYEWVLGKGKTNLQKIKNTVLAIGATLGGIKLAQIASHVLKITDTKLWKAMSSGVSNVNGFVNTLLTKITGTEVASFSLIKTLGGLAGNVASIGLLSKGLDDFQKNLGWTTQSVLETTGGILGMIGTGALMGAQFGPQGALVGGIIGGVEALIVASTKLDTKYQTSKAITQELEDSYKSFGESMDRISKDYETSINRIKENAIVDLANIETAERYADILGNMFDGTGKVTEANQKYAKVLIDEVNSALGTNLTLEDGVIKNGKDIVKNKEELIGIVKKSADALKKETLLQVQQEAYTEAIKKQKKEKEKLTIAEKEYTETITKAIKEYENGNISAVELQKKWAKANEQMIDSQRIYNEAMKETEGSLKDMETALELYANGSAEDMERLITGVVGYTADMQRETEKQWENNTTYIYKILENQKEKYGQFVYDVGGMMKKTSTETSDFAIGTAQNFYNLTDNIQGNLQKRIDNMGNSMVSKIDLINGQIGTVKGNLNTLNGNTYVSTFKLKTDPLNGWKFAYDVNDATKQVSGIKFNKYASGGFPEEGPFYMNKGEIAGKFSNGRSVVANNEQITEGIKRAVIQGMKTALQSSSAQQINLNVVAEEGILVRKVVNGINEITAQTGVSPLNI